MMNPQMGMQQGGIHHQQGFGQQGMGWNMMNPQMGMQQGGMGMVSAVVFDFCPPPSQHSESAACACCLFPSPPLTAANRAWA